QAKPPPKAAPTPKPKAAPAPPPPGEVIRQPRQPVNTTNTDAIVTLMPQTGMDSIPVDYLTVSYFRKVLLPYLNAIAGAQKIIGKTRMVHFLPPERVGQLDKLIYASCI
ncbi:MAG: hypothetical protein GY792_13220, partial [Gammaproteobacteria bacterium]|nr:hypothetical protein [Gammaproteobacteria bacterium]